MAPFPSGHVSTAPAIWTFLGGTTAFPLLVAVLIAVGVAVSRLYLGVHLVDDVVGGLVPGGLLAWLWSRVGRRLVTRIGSWGFGVWLGIAGVVLARALPLEWRYIRYRPPRTASGRIRALLVGGVGVLLPFAADLSPSEESLAFGAGMILLATLWALLLAPAFLTHFG